MSILNNVFGEDNESESSAVGIADLDGAANVTTDSESYDNSDGEVDESRDSNDVGTDFDVGGILGGMTDSESDSDDGSVLGIL